MAVDRERQVAQSRQAAEETRRRAVEKARQETAWIERASREPEQQQEFIRQNNVIYGGLIAMGLVLVQPFLTVSGLDWSAKICVIAFSVAIPLLAALLMVNHQETFRRRVTNSLAVRVCQSIAQMLAYVGVVAGFWHIMWPAGVAIMVSGFAALMVHSAGYFRLEIAAKAEAAAAGAAEPAETAETAGQTASQSPDGAAQ